MVEKLAARKMPTPEDSLSGETLVSDEEIFRQLGSCIRRVK